jgi:hypothetical protein
MRNHVLPVVFILLLSSLLFAGNGKQGNNLSPAQTTGTPTRTYLDINKICTQFTNDGRSDNDASGNSAFIYPAGSGKSCIFESGLLWGAYIPGDSQVRVGGSAYGTGLQGGRITNSNAAWSSLTYDASTADNVRIYRVRADIYPGATGYDLSTAATWEGVSTNDLQTQYLKDYNEWPYAEGAPYYLDDKGNKVPGVKGADQTVWFVANDLNSKLTAGLYGASPMGIEYQATYWAYNQSGALGNIIFKKYKLINKSNTAFNNMYVSMWADPDVGYATDDYAGCDTTLSLGYAYNANTVDATYSPLPPPAVGFDFFQGPKVAGVAGQDLNKNGIDDASDYAIFNGQKIGPGYINLPMTAFYYFANGDANVTDPNIGAIAGSTQFYNFFQGKVGLTGKKFVNPVTGDSTTFVLSGDPIKNTGWIDGAVIAAGDRRLGLASGPFTMAVGDTQEVVVAEIAAGATTGIDRLSAIGLLKYYDAEAQKAYDNNFVVTVDSSVAPPVPKVTPYALDKEIIIEWNTIAADEMGTETFSQYDYGFQGYNVYQLPSATSSIADAKLLASFDIHDGIKNVPGKYYDSTSHSYIASPFSFGSDLGIQRFYDVRSDALNSGLPLINSTDYYFAITAYSYSPTKAIAAESAIKIISIAPAASGIVSDSPVAPSAPVLSSTAMNKEAIVNWDNTASAVSATESLNRNGYKFQGYNVYQLPSATSAATDGVLIGSFDIIDGAINITTQYYSQANNTYYSAPFKFGSDNSVQRFIDIKTDAIANSPLQNDKTYYFGVTAFSYNPKAFVICGMESALKTISVVPHTIPTDTSSTSLTGKVYTNITHASGMADATCYYVISDPTKLKAANYTLGFSPQPDVLTGSGSGIYSNITGEASLLLNESGDQVDYTVSITDASLGGTIVKAGIGDAGSRTINKTVTLLSATVLTHVVGSASGSWKSTDATEPFTSALKSSLMNNNLSFLVIESADTLVVPIKISTYPWYLDREGTRVLSYQRNFSLDNAYMTVDGIQPKIGGLSFSSPITYSSWTLVNKAVPTETYPVAVWGDGYNIFGYATGKGADFYGGGGSTTSTDYSQDIELRFTGVAKDYAGNDKNDTLCTSGGSWASMRSRTSATAQAMVRIPFEVWEVERNRQINCVITERNVDAASPWGNTGTPLWYRIVGRDYIEFIASPYDSTTLKLRTDPYVTWDLILQDGESGHLCTWHTGDILRIKYDNPIYPGIDTYTFKTPGSILSTEKENGKVYTFALRQNYPNPFNPTTKIAYSIPNTAHVSMKIYDILGREVMTLVNGDMKAGEYSVDFNATNFASGVYFYKITAGDKSLVKKMLLLK